MREAFAVQKLLTFFQQKYWHISDINVWNFKETLTNDVVSFEQTRLDSPFRSNLIWAYAVCYSIFILSLQWNLHEPSPLNNSHFPVTASFQYPQSAVLLYI